MAAESDIEQLNVIFSALGTPDEGLWPVRLDPRMHQSEGSFSYDAGSLILIHEECPIGDCWRSTDVSVAAGPQQAIERRRVGEKA